MNLWLPASTAFLASAVEAVEALTIVLAVGTTNGWRVALSGAAWALAALAAIVLVLGPALVTVVPIGAVRLVVGTFLILFGLSWLRKAVARYAGRKALRDEASAYAKNVAALTRVDPAMARIAFATSFKSTLLEGLEVAIIVVTVGTSSPGALGFAAAGGVAAVLLVALLGAALRAPLARVPENALKFAVGVMLTSFGTYWTGEGLGVAWWHDDLAIVLLACAYALASIALVAAGRRGVARVERAA